MAWSTRELADLAGTTVNAVRHYHQRGLLDEPDRRTNGYKQYGVPHLVRLLQIRRLRDIGVPLGEIERLGAEVGTSRDVLVAIDAELKETIARSERTRAEIAEMLRHGSVTEVVTNVPEGFARVAPRLSPAERSLTLVYSQVFEPTAMDDVREILEADADPATAAFESLPADADEETRDLLVNQFADTLAKTFVTYPWITTPEAHLQQDPASAGAAMGETIRALYNPAQLDVLARATSLARARAGG
ncbi:MerR family transcriptional regulator [Promicromonospora citrea]|uniref:Transcriptional regulator, MerR family protein n=1 Tax=Promicromonospora citrea TaxID=43677 RepID=A0A8H9GIB8_9MICO|nr:MerR family transcriptional regulator [Promicromonospora citrea]NNH52577.1 MerR family transcriptional regulator [Promicromonospora citrea]GGM21277.1 transcriptional regulator, MerR family protein [Promicromonospora citrea]